MHWLRKLLADFCRWRANAALRLAGEAIDRGNAWLKCERSIIKQEKANGTEED